MLLLVFNHCLLVGIISPRKQLLEDRNSWKQIHEDFGQAKSIGGAECFDNQSTIKWTNISLSFVDDYMDPLDV